MKLVWNGCDAFIESRLAQRYGHDFEAGQLFSGAHAYSEFDAVEIDVSLLPLDDDGEPDMNGVLASESGKLYRAA